MSVHSRRHSFSAENTDITLSFPPPSPPLGNGRLSFDDKDDFKRPLPREPLITSGASRRRQSSAISWVTNAFPRRLGFYRTEEEDEFGSRSRLLGHDSLVGSLPAKLSYSSGGLSRMLRIRWAVALSGVIVIACIIGAVTTHVEPETIKHYTSTAGTALKGFHESVLNFVSPSSHLSPAAKSPYTCPLPSQPRPNTPLINETLSDPDELGTTYHKFRTYIQHSRTTCNSFRLTLTRRDHSICRYAKTRPVSNDPDISKYIKETLGPDTFQITIDGAERFAIDTPTTFSEGECSYEFDIRLTAPGTVWLSISHIFENNEGFNDLQVNPNKLPNPLHEKVIAGPLQLDLCPDLACPAYVPKMLGSSIIPYQPLKAASSPAVDEFFTTPSSPRLPACSGDTPIYGSYVPASIPSLLFPPEPLPYDAGRLVGGMHHFVPQGCEWKHDGLRFRDHSSCTQKTGSVLFYGDSHGRGASDAVRHRLEGHDGIVDSSPQVAVKTEVVGNVALSFLWDPYLLQPYNCELMGKFDTIVVSSLAHQASYQGTSPTSVILGRLEDSFKSWPGLSLKCRGGRKQTFVYITTPAYQYPKKAIRVEARTSVRLEYWTRRTIDMALNSGWKVVDLFELSKPFAVDTALTDGIHYIKMDVMDVLTDELLDKIGICGNDKAV